MVATVVFREAPIRQNADPCTEKEIRFEIFGPGTKRQRASTFPILQS